MPSSKRRLKNVLPYLLVVLYSIISAFTMFLNGDDFVWYYIDSNDLLSGYKNPNGRYLSNFITINIIKHPIFRCIFVSLVLALLLILLSKLLDLNNRSFSIKLFYSITTVVLIPSLTYCEVISWISGFTNYVFPIMITLIFMLIVFNVLFFEKSFKAYHILLFSLIGLASGLCIEHSTIYNIILGLAVIILLKWRRNKLYIAPFFFLFFSCISAFLMFSNNNYSDISQNDDMYGNRQFVFDTADFFMNIMRTIVVYYTKKFWIINLIICFSIIIMFFKNHDVVKKSKYSYICIVIIVAYSLYSALCAGYTDLVYLSDAMKIRGLEAAFCFLYLVSISYFVWIFFDVNRRIRTYLYLISTLVLSGPFMFIEPATARCFFANYIFWILFSGELLFFIVDSIKPDILKKIYIIAAITASCSILFILNIEITNWYYNYLRFDFIKEQIEEGKSSGIQVIEYPYSDYILDSFQNNSLFVTDLNGGVTYFSLLADYYEFDAKNLNYSSFTLISSSDYYRYISSD
ncbi:MAG: hypothetical protein J6Y71_07965 [Ruminococcus sp.]|nr:hypothetical protein [Ruminococcus sp.]